jgi:hypothetical protein
MYIDNIKNILIIIIAFGLTACGGGGGGGAVSTATAQQDPPPMMPPDPETGFVTIGITDGPMDEARSVVLNITYLELGHMDGSVTRIDMDGGPLDLDMMQLQNGVAHDLVNGARVPAGEYEWMRLGVDVDHSYIDTMGMGGRHGLQMALQDGLTIHHSYFIPDADHLELMMDFDLRLGVVQHHMGMMGDRWELHPAIRLMDMATTGGLVGTVDLSLVDANNPACDPSEGGNWAYLFPGDASVPDDMAETESDGTPGPYAADRVELHTGLGEYLYHFGFLPEGSYRVAFTCSGEWDEEGDDDYPSDPDGRFDFHAFSEPVNVVAGEVVVLDLGP